VAGLRGISREQQDDSGALAEPGREGHRQRFLATRDTPVTLPDGSVVSADDGQARYTMEKVAALKPVSAGGTVTQGTAVRSTTGRGGRGDERLQGGRARHQPLARIVSSGDRAVPESWDWRWRRPAGAGPGRDGHRRQRSVEIRGVRRQVIPSYTDLGVDLAKLNVNGGAIAVGTRRP